MVTLLTLLLLAAPGSPLDWKIVRSYANGAVWQAVDVETKTVYLMQTRQPKGFMPFRRELIEGRNGQVKERFVPVFPKEKQQWFPSWDDAEAVISRDRKIRLREWVEEFRRNTGQSKP